MKVHRLRGRAELSQLRGRGGYVLNIGRSGARIHRNGCATVAWMNPDKRGGVYHSPTLEDALRWLETKVITGVPCRLCLPALTYRPPPESLLEHLGRADA